MKRHATNSGKSTSKRLYTQAKPVNGLPTPAIATQTKPSLFSQPKTILQWILGWLTLAEASPLVRSCKHMHQQHLMFQDKPIFPNGWNLFDVLERVEYLFAHAYYKEDKVRVCHIPIQQLQFVLLRENDRMEHICIHPTGISARADCQAEFKHWDAKYLSLSNQGYNGNITHCIQAIGLSKAWRCHIQFLSFIAVDGIEEVVFISEQNWYHRKGSMIGEVVNCIEYERTQNMIHSFLVLESNLIPQQRVCFNKYEIKQMEPN